jgi:phosphoribosyl 1,2-cyclic phosphodiesterase
MIGFCPLASGSKGNAIYLGTKETKILIDAGISYKQLQLRLSEIGVDVADIEAVLITHEHMDHIAGLKTLCTHSKVCVISNAETAKGIYQNLQFLPRFKIFTTGEAFEFKDLRIHPFSVQHDTLDPVGFVIETQNLKLGFCTDLGYVTSLVVSHLQGCDYLYLEANHEPESVYASNRSYIYKQRVLSRQGHLSNQESSNLLLSVMHKNLKHVHLAHLSSECNSEKGALQSIRRVMEKAGHLPEISIAYQDKISEPVYFDC